MDTKTIQKIQSWKGFELFNIKDPNYLSKDEEIFDWHKIPVLFKAIERGDSKVVMELIKLGADVNFINPGSNTSPLLAFEEKARNRSEITKELLNAGANANYVSTFDFGSEKIIDSPLMDACRDGCIESVRALVKARADVNFKGSYGLTSLCSINEESKHYSLISQILIKGGADVNGCEGYPLQLAIKESKFDVIKTLVDAGARLDIPNSDKHYNGRTAFMSFLKGEAIDLGGDEEEELFLLFCKNIGNVNVQDNDGKSLIFYVIDTYIGGDNFDLFILDRILFNENIDINLTDNNKNNILNSLLLTIEEEGEITDELFDDERYKIESSLIAGSNVEIRNNSDDSPKIVAKRIGNKDIQILIKNANSLINMENYMGQTPLFIASLQGNAERVKWLIKKGAYINAKNKCHKILRSLEVYGTKVPWGEEDIKPKFYSSLMVTQNIETIKALIQAGVDINQQNSEGNTALMLYTKDNWYEGVTELLSAGANTSLKNNEHETALKIAKRNLKSKIVRSKQPEKLVKLLQGHTIEKTVPSILSSLFMGKVKT